MSIIKISNLTFGYDSSADLIFDNISLQLDSNWRLGLIGRNGKGKTTFLKLLMGEYKFSGSISSSVEFEYFPYEVINTSLPSWEIADSICNCEQWELIREMSYLNLSADLLYREFRTLSQGEQAKLLLAYLFLKENRFLLIDEPTNHLDSEARNTVAEYLKRKSGFILISHDQNLLDRTVDHILSINRCNTELQKGIFSSWWESKQATYSKNPSIL